MKLQLNFFKKLGIAILIIFPGSLLAQADTTAGGAKPVSPTQRPAGGVKPYKEVITARAKTDEGLFKVHQLDSRYFFEIADSLLGRDILIVNRIAKGATGVRSGMSGFAGDQIGENVIRFEKGPNNKLFVKNISFSERGTDSTENGMYRSVLNSNLQPIAASFDIKAFGKDSVTKSASIVIDVTDFVSGDNDVLFFDGSIKRMFGLGAIMADRSYIDTIRSFATNIEIQTIKTYQKGGGPAAPGAPPSIGGPVTFELNSSILLLPKKPMTPRYFDGRVGYFATGYTDFDANPQGVKDIYMITRWRLEPKAEDIEKYKRGELVEPKKQIVYYIDPLTPKKWVPYLIAGVNDWNAAFEKAGWKNAIVAKPAPENDPTWSIDDAQHSAIVYKPSSIPNASGPQVNDPRSGEILETHINWYHNVMTLIRNWYMIQAAAIDPRARTMKFDDELMGQLIRFVSSHEVGHTLGLRHNFGSSSTVPVEKLRDKAWVEANGHTPSIMDYARFNYVAQPEDSIGPKGIFPRIGDYDKWAIEWGYRWFPQYKTAEEEDAYLNKWIIEKTGSNKRLWFGTESDALDPRSQNEDLGDNAMKASAYGIKNLKRIMPNILEWTNEPNESYLGARQIYLEVVTQFSRFMGHVCKNIGGVTNTPRSREEAGPVYDYVPKATQKEAIQFLQQQLFTTPKWLLDAKLFKATGVVDYNTINSLQSFVLNRVLTPMVFAKLQQFEAFDGAAAYTLTEMLNDLKKGIWSELPAHQPIDIYRRNLQKTYAEKIIELIKLFNEENPSADGKMGKTSDAASLIKGQAKTLMAEIKAAIPAAPDAVTKLHLQDLLERFTNAFSSKN